MNQGGMEARLSQVTHQLMSYGGAVAKGRDDLGGRPCAGGCVGDDLGGVGLGELDLAGTQKLVDIGTRDVLLGLGRR